MKGEELIEILLSKMSENDRATRCETAGLVGVTREDIIRAAPIYKTQKALLLHFGKVPYSDSHLTKFLESATGWADKLMKHKGPIFLKKLELFAKEILEERKEEVSLSIVKPSNASHKVLNPSNPRVLCLDQDSTPKTKKAKVSMLAQEYIDRMSADGFYSIQEKLIAEAILEKYEREY